MAKSKEKILARKFRKEGLSMKEIAMKLNVSKSSVSLWCSDIILNEKQIANLHKKMVRGSYIGRMLGTQMQKDKKKKNIENCLLQAKKDIPRLRERELFFAGLGLYWGEGSKKSAVRFYNSDPEAVKFMMKWFREVLKIENSQFYMYVNVNQIHRDRLDAIIEYWSKITGIDASQFRRPSLIKARNKKVYDNFSEHYGTLCVRIARSSNLLYQILGWIKVMAG